MSSVSRHKAKWRLLKFLIVTSSSSSSKPSERNIYALLQPWSKKTYREHQEACRELQLQEDLEDFYIDMKTRKIWRVVKSDIPASDIERFAISEALERGIVIEPYNPALASRMAPLKFLQQTLVEWWCR